MHWSCQPKKKQKKFTNFHSYLAHCKIDADSERKKNSIKTIKYQHQQNKNNQPTNQITQYQINKRPV